MTRVYHTYDKWECYPAGLYETTPPKGMTAKDANEAYRDFLKDTPLFESQLKRLIEEWPHSTEHYLSNEKMNRIAWLGQAAVCIHSRIPQGFRGGFNLLSKEEQQIANEVALKWLNVWLVARSEGPITMEQAGIASEVNLY
jgi:hypothetical protein